MLVKAANAIKIGVAVGPAGACATGGSGVAVANTIKGVPVVKAMAVSCASITAAVAAFWAVGVAVTICGAGVLVASTRLIGVGVRVPMVEMAVNAAFKVAAASTSAGTAVAVTAKGVRVGVAVRICTGLAVGGVPVSSAIRVAWPFMATAVATFCGVGVAVTTRGATGLVASTRFAGSGVAVPT